MYTQCPKCLTYFQVTAEHLKVAQGNVRCGQCSNVFSALGNLSEVPPQQSSSTPSERSDSPSGQTAKPSQATGKPSPKVKSQSNPQSKLSNAIAAIQALNQSSQKILSQGRKNYVTQLQQNSKSNRKNRVNEDEQTENGQESLQDTGQLEAVQQSATAENNQHEKDFDIEQALAAVDDIDIDDIETDRVPASTDQGNSTQSQETISEFDEIQAMMDDLPLTEQDIAEALEPESKPVKKQVRSDKRNIKKPSAKNDADFNITNLEPPSAQPRKNTEAEKKPRFPSSRKPEIRPRKKLGTTAKKTTALNPNKKQVSRPQNVRQHIVSDPEVIIENNIPTLAIPKQLLDDFNQDIQINPAHYRSMITWGVLSLILMFVFLGQAIYFKHNELGQVSQLRPYVEMFCRHASCELSMQADIGMIELLGQDIRSHPKSKQALLVSATIINNAPFTQPFPGLRLSFSDMNGEKVATRNFMPQDYLPKNIDLLKGMESNIPIQIELQIVDPGKSAVNFEFDFFSI